MNRLTYYPGCSLKGTAKDYAESILGICANLGIALEEIDDWNCCGATAAHSIDHRASLELAARNLNLAAAMSANQMLVPCPLCFNRLKTASIALKGDQGARYSVELPDSVPRIRDLADFFAGDDMIQRVARQVKNPLKGLKVVCYYGCMANRPPEITEAADCENPHSLDRIVENLGGTPISWPFKTDCCGAGHVLPRPDIVTNLVGKLADMAERSGARAIVVSCQLCQANLDLFQERAGALLGKPLSLPVYYFSELIGLAMGAAGAKKWLSRHVTEPFALLDELGLLKID